MGDRASLLQLLGVDASWLSRSPSYGSGSTICKSGFSTRKAAAAARCHTLARLADPLARHGCGSQARGLLHKRLGVQVGETAYWGVRAIGGGGYEARGPDDQVLAVCAQKPGHETRGAQDSAFLR
eukprot:scaffold3.g6229.t1